MPHISAYDTWSTTLRRKLPRDVSTTTCDVKLWTVWCRPTQPKKHTHKTLEHHAQTALLSEQGCPHCLVEWPTDWGLMTLVMPAQKHKRK